MQATHATPSHKLAGLDHLRALAITLVLLYHYQLFAHPAWIESAGEFGWTGVDLFFVLSGYLIASQLFTTIARGYKADLKEFYIKRTFRIIPAYLLTVGLYFLVPPFREFNGIAPLWKFITFTQNFGLDARYYRAFSHCWSLCVEEQFYLILPLLLVLMHFLNAGKKAFIIIPLLFIAGFIIRILIYHFAVEPLKDDDAFGVLWTKNMYYPTYARLDGLLAGVTIAAVSVFKPVTFKRITKYGNAMLLISLLMLAGAYFICKHRTSFLSSVFGFPAVSIAYATLVLAALSPGCVLYKYRSRFTSSLATLSFSIYLIHKGIFHITQTALSKQGIDVNSTLVIVPCIVMAILVAMIMRYAIEKPFLKLRDKVLLKMKTKKMKQPLTTA